MASHSTHPHDAQAGQFKGCGPAPQTKSAGQAHWPPAWPRALEFGPTPGGHLQAVPQGRGQP